MTRRDIPLDASAILRALAGHDVDYIVIGGLAVQAHGHPRTTQDLDLIPEPSPVNRKRLRAALSELGARRVGWAKRRLPRLPTGGVLELDTDAGGLDLHFDPPGAAPYSGLRSRALELHVFDLDVRVVGLDDLIAMKQASGRPIDRGDIATLTEQ